MEYSKKRNDIEFDEPEARDLMKKIIIGDELCCSSCGKTFSYDGNSSCPWCRSTISKSSRKITPNFKIGPFGFFVLWLLSAPIVIFGVILFIGKSIGGPGSGSILFFMYMFPLVFFVYSAISGLIFFLTSGRTKNKTK